MRTTVMRYLCFAFISYMYLVPGYASGTSGRAMESASHNEAAAAYLLFGQPFVVNIKGDADKMHYLMIDAALKFSSATLAKQAQVHLPRVRHELILMLSEQHYEDITTDTGTLDLKNKALEIVRTVYASVANNIAIEDIYFTRLAIR